MFSSDSREADSFEDPTDLSGHALPGPAIALHDVLTEVDSLQLQHIVEQIAVPRHYDQEPVANREIADYIEQTLQGLGLQVSRMGAYDNIVAWNTACENQPAILIGAHYDSVPHCPGADDNGSAVAGMLMAATLLTKYYPELPLFLVAFNREEDGLLGSKDFVNDNLSQLSFELSQVHILEMIGYCDNTPGSQQLPQGLPVALPPSGNFIGVLANRQSEFIHEAIVAAVTQYVPDLPIEGIVLPPGAEQLPSLAVVRRSDHAPFWDADIPAVMWTDTAEYRNHHYHRVTDTPDTLDYEFMAKVTRALIASIVSNQSGPA